MKFKNKILMFGLILLVMTRAVYDISPYDVSEAIYNDYLDISSQDAYPQGMSWNNDGTKMYLVGNNHNKIYEYSCSAFDVSTCSYVDYLDISSQDIDPRGMSWNNDGTKMYMLGVLDDKIYEYSCSAFDVSTCSYVDYLDISSQDIDSKGMSWNNDGTKVYLVGSYNDKIYEYSCSAFDVSTCSYVDYLDISSQDTDPRGMSWNNDGTKMYLVGFYNTRIYEYSCSAFDVSTCSYVDHLSIWSEDTDPKGMSWNNDGTKMYLVGNYNDKIYEYYIDTIPPTLSVTSPTNTTYNNDSSTYDVPITYTVTDDVGIDKCWYKLDDNSNQTIQNCANTSVNVDSNEHILIIATNDTSGNRNESTIHFSFYGNVAPSVSLNSPADNSTEVYLFPDLNVTVTDPDGDIMNVSFYNNADDSQIGTTQTNIANGSTAQVTWSALSYGTTYSWYVNVTDGINTIQSDVWTFTTDFPPDDPVLNYPPNNGENILYPTTLNVSVTDPDSPFLNVSFYNADDFSLIGQANVTNDSSAIIVWYGLSYNTTYKWYVEVYDGIITTTSSTWNFTTLPLIIQIQSPTNTTYNTANISLNFTVNEAVDTCKYELNDVNHTIACDNTTFLGTEGSNHVKVWAEDMSGNWGESSTVYFSVDTTPPTITIQSPTNTTYNTSTLDFNVSLNEDGNSCGFLLDINKSGWVDEESAWGHYLVTDPENIVDENWTTLGYISAIGRWININYTFDSTPSSINYVVQFNGIDSDRYLQLWCKNWTSNSYILIANETSSVATNLTGSYPTDCLSSTLDLKLDATTSPGYGIQIYEEKIELPDYINMTKHNNTYFNYTKTGLADGHHYVKFKCTDKNENSNISTIHFSIDTTPPTITNESLSTTLANINESIKLNATVIDNVGVDTVKFYIEPWGNITASSTGNEYYVICNSTNICNTTNAGSYNFTDVWTNDSSNNIQTSHPNLQFNIINRNITNCTTINYPGTYYLINDIANSSVINYCIKINTDNVTLDCKGFSVDGKDHFNQYGISASGTNITIKNCIVTDWNAGISLNNNNTVMNSTINSNEYHGLTGASNNVIYNITANNNTAADPSGRSITLSGDNNILENITCNYNAHYGIYISGKNNTLKNIETKENHLLDLKLNLEYLDDCNNKFINITGSNDLPIKLYNSTSINLTNEEFSELFLCNVSNSNLKNITINGSQTYKNNQLFILYSHDINLSDITSINNYYGVYIFTGNTYWINIGNLSNIRTENSTFDNNYYGVYVDAYNINDMNISFVNISVKNNKYGVNALGNYPNKGISVINSSILNSSDYDYYIYSSILSAINTNFTDTRKIFFYNQYSKFKYKNDSSDLELTTNTTGSYPTIYRKLLRWTQDEIKWEENSSSIQYYCYSVYGLYPNTEYRIYNGSSVLYKTTNSSGSLSFNLTLDNSARNITVGLPPIINSTTLIVTDLGNSRNMRLKINVSYPDNEDRNTCYFGAYSNTTFDGDFCYFDISSDLSQSGTVICNDTYNANDTFSIDFTLTDNSYTENSSYLHNLSSQEIMKNDTLTNNDATNDLGYEITHGMPSTWSYQEDANEVNAISQYLDLDYNKPDMALGTSRWQVKYGYDGSNPLFYNITLPSDCWNYSSTINLRILSRTGDFYWDYYSRPLCYNGSSWIYIGINSSGFIGGSYTHPGGFTTMYDGDWNTFAWWSHDDSEWIDNAYGDTNAYVRIYEEAMWWDISKGTLNHGGTFTGTLSPAGSINMSSSWTGDWIDETIGDWIEDSSYDNSLSSQKIIKELSATSTYNFTNVKTSDVTVPDSDWGDCDNCGSYLINITTTYSNSSQWYDTGDVISDTFSDFKQNEGYTTEVGGTAYITSDLTVTNNDAFTNFTSIHYSNGRSGWTCQETQALSLDALETKIIKNSYNCTKENVITAINATNWTQDTSETTVVDGTAYIKAQAGVNNTDSIISYENVTYDNTDAADMCRDPTWTCSIDATYYINTTNASVSYDSIYSVKATKANVITSVSGGNNDWRQDEDQTTVAGGTAYIEGNIKALNNDPILNFTSVSFPDLSSQHRTGWTCSYSTQTTGNIANKSTWSSTSYPETCSKSNVITKDESQPYTYGDDYGSWDNYLMAPFSYFYIRKPIDFSNTDSSVSFENVSWTWSSPNSDEDTSWSSRLVTGYINITASGSNTSYSYIRIPGISVTNGPFSQQDSNPIVDCSLTCSEDDLEFRRTVGIASSAVATTIPLTHFNTSLVNTTESGTLRIYDESDNQVTPETVDLTQFYTIYNRTSIAPNASLNYKVYFNISGIDKVVSIYQNNVTRTWYKYINVSDGNDVDVTNVRISEPMKEGLISYKLYLKNDSSWTDVTGESEYSWSPYDADGDGKVDYVNFTIPSLSKREFRIVGDIGLPVERTITKEIVNIPIVSGENVHHNWTISYYNPNIIDAELSDKLRIAEDAFNIELDNLAVTKRTDEYGSYILIEDTIPVNTTYNYTLEFLTPTVSVFCEIEDDPDKYWVGYKAQIKLNCSVVNRASTNATNVRKQINLINVEDLELLENSTVLDKESRVRDFYEINIDEISGYETKKYELRYKIPTATITEKDLPDDPKTGKKQRVYTVESVSAYDLDPLWVNITMDSSRVISINDVETGKNLSYKAGNEGETSVEIGKLVTGATKAFLMVYEPTPISEIEIPIKLPKDIIFYVQVTVSFLMILLFVWFVVRPWFSKRKKIESEKWKKPRDEWHE